MVFTLRRGVKFWDGHPVTPTGAYKFKSWTPGVGVVAVANPHYWNPSVSSAGAVCR